MKIDNFANRLELSMKEKNIKSVDLVKKTKIDKSAISHYLAGKYEAKPDNLIKLAEVLDVNEQWLLGYDVPKERNISLLVEGKSEAILFNHIMNLAKDKVEQELLVKCTMLDLDNQKKLLELANLYLKGQKDYAEQNEKEKWVILDND